MTLDIPRLEEDIRADHPNRDSPTIISDPRSTLVAQTLDERTYRSGIGGGKFGDWPKIGD
jgi:hypothetical protein